MATKKLEKLKKERLKKGYTMEEVANKVGICKASYCLIEHGKRNLYYKKAVEIAKIFNKKPDDLFYPED